VLDRWVLAELDHVVTAVDAALEDFDTAASGRVLAQFVDDLSNWYVRRSRARFWIGDRDALATLHECLHVVTRLLAPFVPFITEQVWQHAVKPGDASAADSVHLTAWPIQDAGRADDDLRADMDTARQLVEVGRAVRKTTNIRTRQPMQRALVGVPGGRELPTELIAEVADELNVREVIPLARAGEVVDINVKPNFRALGKRFGARTQQAANAISAADHRELARSLKTQGQAGIHLDGEDITVTLDEVTLTEVPRSGWAVTNHQDVTVALDTTITPELRRAGVAREVIRLVQAARKEADFEVADRVVLSWVADGETAEALREHERELADAVLAVDVVEHPPATIPVEANASDTGVREDDELGVRFWLDRADNRSPRRPAPQVG